MNVGFSEADLLAGYAAWLRWLEQKRQELAGKQAKLERRMGRSPAVAVADTPDLAENREDPVGAAELASLPEAEEAAEIISEEPEMQTGSPVSSADLAADLPDENPSLEDENLLPEEEDDWL